MTIATYRDAIRAIQNYLDEGDSSISLQRIAFNHIAQINNIHAQLNGTSGREWKELFFSSGETFQRWNSDHPAKNRITLTAQLPSICTYLGGCACSIVDPDGQLLLIDGQGTTKLEDVSIEQALREYGGLTLRNFGVTPETLEAAFQTITHCKSTPYLGNSPRPVISGNVIKSTAVAAGSDLPLHQECAGTAQAPAYIAFLCNQPASWGGATTFANAARVTEMIKKEAADIWIQLENANLTYTMRLLPDKGARTWLTKKLNPSHATVSEFFGTDDLEKINQICETRRMTLDWNQGWAVVTQTDIPAVRDGVYHAQIHTDILTPELCGNKLNYLVASTLLYPTEESCQYSVRFASGKAIHPEMASRLLRILKKCEIAPQWKAGDLRVQSNRHFHGKRAHGGPRDVVVVMGG